MRISDWSSDVCSSDLLGERVVRPGIVVERHCAAIGREVVGAQPILANDDGVGRNRADLLDETREVEGDLGIGRPVVSDGGCDGLRLAESVDLHHPWHDRRSEEHTSELQSLMRISYAVFCLKKKNNTCKTTCTELKGS